MIGVTVRNNDEVEFGEVGVEGLDVVLEDFRVVAGVEEDALAVVLDEGGETPVTSERLIAAEGVVENGDAVGSGRACRRRRIA